MYNINKIRNDFPMLKNSKTIYLDNAATTYKPQQVIDAVVSYMSKLTSNSGRGDYIDAYKVDLMVDETRNIVKEFINAKSADEIIFTSGTTMSLNLVAEAYGLKHLQPGDEIILSVAEHASNTLPWIEVSKKTGAIIKYVPLNNKGFFTAFDVKAQLTSRTKIVSLAHISNVLGHIIDIKEIASVVHEIGAILVVDGAQSVPHLQTDVQDLDIDFLAFSGHKMLAPTGIGVLFGKRHLIEAMAPFIVGGGNNHSYDKTGMTNYFKAPQKYEAGTLNIEGIFGLNAALKYLTNVGLDKIKAHEESLRAYAISKLKMMPHIELYNENASVGIITFNVKGVHCQDIATFLSSKNIAVRSGQHCAKILSKELGVEGTVRASFYLYTSKADVDSFIDAVSKAEDFLDVYFE